MTAQSRAEAGLREARSWSARPSRHGQETGGSGLNIITGDEHDNLLIGGRGNDTYIFRNGWGEDIVVEKPGEGQGTLDFSALTGDLVLPPHPFGSGLSGLGFTPKKWEDTEVAE